MQLLKALTPNELQTLVRDLHRALDWAMFYALPAHEEQHPGETYERDNYVSHSVKQASEVLARVDKLMEGNEMKIVDLRQAEIDDHDSRDHLGE